MEIKALAEFQSVPSIGPRFAHDLISLGYYSLNDLKKKDPTRLYSQLERNIGAWIDPCVEDQFRLVVHYSNHRNTNKNWWDFTEERKSFREKNGYANNRPKKAWYELDQYKSANKLSTKTNHAKNDLAARLKKSMSFIKKNYTEKISLEELSKIALLSPFHFLRSFKSVYEQSPLEFITHLRLKKACELLKKTEDAVAEIALQSGFEDSSSFIRLFKTRFNQTPRQFREDNLIEVP
jgi:AraC-like DNA-binding protein